MPSQPSPNAIYLADYKPTDFSVSHIDLTFDLHPTQTKVSAQLKVARRATTAQDAPLVLHGEALRLLSVALDGNPLSAGEYVVDDETLTIPKVPDAFTLMIETQINPQDNTTLNGLYMSSGNFCTQCEAEGFRRITYMYDRPDVPAIYSTTIIADKHKFPVMLSNGNLVDRGDVKQHYGRHWVKWQDPFPKPTYLFALVAGDLACISDKFTTMSGRDIDLQIFVQHHNRDKCDHAMRSLKNAMRWDEKTYGREYDLDIYMIVAVDDFNMGAMENKGLNVFNSKYVLAKPDTATDNDYQGIEGVIGHEYFHNWSGNRVTCRDWFQLSLKEGFTVFRDQSFSMDMASAGVKRIGDVNILRNAQFKEDSGPMAHPVRPESYVEINNFYTVTIYNKGAEVVRMLHHLLGAEKFRKGTDLYFQRHDGQAVTTDDFVKALEDANGVDFTQFKRWYSQAGTPELHVDRSYDAANKTYTLTIQQTCPPTPGQTHKEPFHIPVALGLVGTDGRDLPLTLENESAVGETTRVLHLNAAQQSFTFKNVDAEPIPSILRGFSAPVKVYVDLSDVERCFLMAHDSDDFNRWDAGQQLGVKLMTQMAGQYQQQQPLTVADEFIDAFEKILNDDDLDKELAAQALILPSEGYIGDAMPTIFPDAIHHVRLFVKQAIAKRLQAQFASKYAQLTDNGAYSVDQQSIGRRALRNVCLSYLMELDDAVIVDTCMQQFQSANNMTDVMAALVPLANKQCTQREQALDEFYAKWKDDPLVIDKWLGIQASSRLPGTLQHVKKLTSHESFSVKNPNKVRALIGAFSHGNPLHFHAADGSGYEFLTHYILQLNSMNPQMAARLVSALSFWKRYDDNRQQLMKNQLQNIANTSGLSKDVYEIVNKSLV